MYRKIYECQVKIWQSDATGKRALKWINMPVEKAMQRADAAVRCLECRGPITLHSSGPRNAPQAHAKHSQKFPGCSFGDYFDGHKRRSPTPIE
jgi:hypothetical protein